MTKTPRPVSAHMHFICALERLSESQRTTLFRKLCRECPRLQHARLAHDPKVVNSLRGVLARATGLTFVIGATNKERNFLITALGNSVTQLMPEKIVSGIDVHTPIDFVPVAGVCYLSKVSNSPQCLNSILQLWEELNCRPTNVVLLNGVWSMIPEIRRSAVGLAKERNVIVADEFVRAPELRNREGKLISFLRVRTGNLKDEIHVEVEPDVS